MNCLPQDIIINYIFSHLYPEDLERCEKVNNRFKQIINNNKTYILQNCQHIQPHGVVEIYYNNNKHQLKYKKNYKDGKEHGECKEWYENGQLYVQEYYINGKRHGEYKTWFSNGKLHINTQYTYGKKDATIIYSYLLQRRISERYIY